MLDHEQQQQQKNPHNKFELINTNFPPLNYNFYYFDCCSAAAAVVYFCG